MSPIVAWAGDVNAPARPRPETFGGDSLNWLQPFGSGLPVTQCGPRQCDGGQANDPSSQSHTHKFVAVPRKMLHTSAQAVPVTAGRVFGTPRVEKAS